MLQNADPSSMSGQLQCRFCDFRAAYRQVMTRHVRSVHGLRENWCGVLTPAQWEGVKERPKATRPKRTFRSQFWVFAVSAILFLVWENIFVIMWKSLAAKGLIPEEGSWPELLLWWGPVALLSMTSLKIARSRALKEQSARDEFVKQIIRSVQAGMDQSFSLYLRSFVITNRLAAPKVLSFHSDSTNFRWRDQEWLLADAMEPLLPMVALGSPGEAVGAGRLKTDDADWERVFLVFAEAATLIFLVPGSSPGLATEVADLHSRGLLAKTVFVMPAAGLFSRRTRTRDWESAAAIMAQVGIKLPEYHRRGMVFAYGGNFSDPVARRLPRLLQPKRIRRTVEALIRPSGPTLTASSRRETQHGPVQVPQSAANVAKQA